MISQERIKRGLQRGIQQMVDDYDPPSPRERLGRSVKRLADLQERESEDNE